MHGTLFCVLLLLPERDHGVTFFGGLVLARKRGSGSGCSSRKVEVPSLSRTGLPPAQDTLYLSESSVLQGLEQSTLFTIGLFHCKRLSLLGMSGLPVQANPATPVLMPLMCPFSSRTVTPRATSTRRSGPSLRARPSTRAWAVQPPPAPSMGPPPPLLVQPVRARRSVFSVRSEILFCTA